VTVSAAADLDKVLARITTADVAELALALGNVDSPSGAEHQVSDYLFDWCAEHGLAPVRQRAVPDLAANVVGRVRGAGPGTSLLFNSHMDTAVAPGDPTYFRDPDATELHGAWRDGDDLVGIGVVNDKGPMACWLLAAAAIRAAGVRLNGDLVLTMVTGEIGHEPVDDRWDLTDQGKDYGSRFVATHGALADYVLVAETTGFTPVWVEPGKAFFRIAVRGRDRGVYTPYLERPYGAGQHPNAIVQAAPLIARLEEWALDWERRGTADLPGGTVVPKVNIGAVRAGHPTQPILTPATCWLYLDVRVPPGQTPLAARRELAALVLDSGVDADVDCYLFRRGYEAVGAEPLVARLRAATAAELPEPPAPPPRPVASSMWRDINVWNELGIPAVTFGPGAGTGGGNARIPITALAQCARIYARTALAVCQGPDRA
jgi:acetylornithine deacetylase/succinyl-diaminopimelate desuccinylase-like protein